VALAGVLEPHDGGGVLLEAAAMLAARRPGSIRIDIIGTGTDVVDLQRQAVRLGLVGLVSWAGWLRGEDYYERLHSAHVGVAPDPDHSFSRVSTMMKVAEYLAGGMACVAADLPENRVTAGDAALYFRPGDAADLARRLDELIDAPDLLEEVCRRARHRGPSLVWSHSAERLSSSYRWLLGQGESVATEQAITG
jgi:glycosyltransferase involved in cell wall biosynthesis